MFTSLCNLKSHSTFLQSLYCGVAKHICPPHTRPSQLQNEHCAQFLTYQVRQTPMISIYYCVPLHMEAICRPIDSVNFNPPLPRPSTTTITNLKRKWPEITAHALQHFYVYATNNSSDNSISFVILLPVPGDVVVPLQLIQGRKSPEKERGDGERAQTRTRVPAS